MPHPNAINPKTGKRYSWEADQARINAAQIELKQLEADRKVMLRQQAILRAQKHLMDYTLFTSPDPQDPNDIEKSSYDAQIFHRLIADALTDMIIDDAFDQLIFVMPPRHGKTLLSTKKLAAWYSGLHPAHDVAVASYSDTMAEDMGADTRFTILSAQHKQVFPGHVLRKGGTSKSNIQTTQGGRLVFVGRGGALTGRGMHLGIGDDLFKDHEEARSQTIRDQAWNWFTKVFMTRRMGKKKVILTFCLTGDTPVSMADGTWKRLDQVRAGDKVLSWSKGRQVSRRVTKASAQKEDEIFEVRTNGSVVKGNARHPFLVMRGGGPEWVRLGDLSVGDEIVSSGRAKFRRDALFTEEEAWVLGFFMGDGWVTVNRKQNKKRNGAGRFNPTQSYVSCLAHCPKYPDRDLRAVKYCEERFGAKFKMTKFGYWRTEKAVLGRWLLEHGMDAGAKEKRVPQDIMSQPANIRRAFLEGFSAADGCVLDRTGAQEHHNAKGGYVVTQVLLANPNLLADLRLLARGLGIRVTNTTHSVTIHHPPHSAQPQQWHNWSFRYHHRFEREEAFVTDKIRSITPAGREIVYDLTIDKSENFIADGLVVHNTRWHSDDIIGRITDPENPHFNAIEAKKWKIIRLPAIAEDDDPLGRVPGEPLWPERYDLDFLQSQQRLDPLGFAALYQQSPTVADGVMFRRENIMRYDPKDLPDDLRFYAASDHAVATSQRNDPSCFLKGGIDRQDNLYLTDIFWQRVKSDQAVEAMLTMGSGNNKPIMWWAERGHISQSIGPFLNKRMLETGNYIQIVEVTPVKDKEQRAQSIAARVAMGKVWIPKGPLWDKMVDEMLAFPNGTHDDAVDALAHLGMGLQSMFGRGAPAPLKNKATHGTFAWLKQNDAWHDAKRKAAKAIGEY